MRKICVDSPLKSTSTRSISARRRAGAPSPGVATKKSSSRVERSWARWRSMNPPAPGPVSGLSATHDMNAEAMQAAQHRLGFGFQPRADDHACRAIVTASFRTFSQMMLGKTEPLPRYLRSFSFMAWPGQRHAGYVPDQNVLERRVFGPPAGVETLSG